MHREKLRERDFNNLAHVFVGSDKCKVCRVGGWAGNQGRPGGQVQRQSAGRIPSSFGKVSLFLLRPSTDWKRPTHIVEGNILYSKSTDLNVNLI